MRLIAKEAQVNPSLVLYFFNNKQRLFTESILPLYGPMQALPLILTAHPSTIPRRLAAFVAELLSEPQTAEMATSLVRAATSNDEAATALKEEFLTKIGDALAHNPGIQQPYLQANFISSQFIGVVTVRHILNLEPLASSSPSELESYLERLFTLVSVSDKH